MPRQSRFTPYLAATVKRGAVDAVDVGAKIMESEEGVAMSGLPRNMVRQMVESKAGEVLAEAEYRRKVVLSVLKAVAQGLATLPGQRLILFLSDGFTMMDHSGGTDTYDVQGAISKAVRSGVRIYSLDARGLQPPSEFDASLPTVPLDGKSMGLLSSLMSASEKDVQDGMNALASDTGGKFFRNTNDLKGSLQNAIDDNRDYYELAYYPSDFKDSRSFRRITVRIRNHPEYRVRAQSGYLVSDYRPESQTESARSPHEKLFRAITSPLPVTAIRVGATASHLEVDADTAQVSLEAWIDGAGLTYSEQGGQFQMEIEVATVVSDRFGKVVHTDSRKIQGGFPADQLESVKRTGFRYTTRIGVKPGHY
jgi:VWFA-related protein